MGEGDGIFSCGKIAVLKAFEPVTDNFEQVGVKNAVYCVFVLPSSILKSNHDFLRYRKLFIDRDQVFVIRSAVAGFVYCKYSIELFPFLNCVKFSHL